MLTTLRPRWVHAVAPDDAEQATLRERGVPAHFLRHALDVHEQARVEHDEGGAALIVLRVPDGDGARSTSLSVVYRADLVVTIATHELEPIASAVARLDDDPPPSVVLPELVHDVAAAANRRVDRLDDTVDQLELALRTSMGNEKVVRLLECQKALVHLERALVSDQIMLEHLLGDRRIALDAAARRRLDEALVEVRQVIQMTAIAAEILASMMDAFASIISNNLNRVMKLMAAVTIILAIPTMVAGLWGMNVPVPGSHDPWAFAALVAGLAATSLGVLVLFRWRRWV